MYIIYNARQWYVLRQNLSRGWQTCIKMPLTFSVFLATLAVSAVKWIYNESEQLWTILNSSLGDQQCRWSKYYYIFLSTVFKDCFGMSTHMYLIEVYSHAHITLQVLMSWCFVFFFKKRQIQTPTLKYYMRIVSIDHCFIVHYSYALILPGCFVRSRIWVIRDIFTPLL